MHTLPIAPAPWDKRRTTLWNLTTPWRWRGVSWRVPIVGRLGFVAYLGGRWRALL